MKIINYWIVALMVLSCSSTFVSCSSDDESDNTQEAKAIAGTYSGYSIGDSQMFSDYLMGDQATTTITANEDGTINLVYKSGSGDFTLNNLEISSKSFSGEGEVSLSMSGGVGTNYAYTLEASVDDSKELTLKANIPAVMSGLDVSFIQGETPLPYYIAATYKYDSELSMTVNGSSFGSTTDCKVVIKRASDTTVNITINGFGNLAGEGPNMNLGDFTISGVKVATGANKGYSLSLGEFESDANGTPITGVSLSGTVAADGTANMAVAFKPGSMPMPITAVFTGSNTQSSAE